MNINRHDQLSVNRYFRRLGENHTPEFQFAGQNQAQWKSWKQQLLPRVKETLGRLPEKVPLNTEMLCEWEEDGVIKQKVIFDVEEGLSVIAYLFRPANVSGKLPAILAWHGHGPYGKEAVMGVCPTDNADLQANIKKHNYAYGLAMAKAGFATIAIDARGFGERDDRKRPWFTEMGKRDICNLHYIRANLMGMTTLGMNIHDGMCALDYLCEQDFIDTDHIGVMGLSFGGTMTTWMSIFDDRIKASDIICYSDHFASFALSRCNFCGSQLTPGLFQLCDVPDLQGLIAPKPLLVEIGVHDHCFPVGSAMDCFRAVEKIYAAAGVGDHLGLDLFEDGHVWGANKSVDFFNKHLKKPQPAR